MKSLFFYTEDGDFMGAYSSMKEAYSEIGASLPLDLGFHHDYKDLSHFEQNYEEDFQLLDVEENLDSDTLESLKLGVGLIGLVNMADLGKLFNKADEHQVKALCDFFVFKGF
jgi:hypothetical protein